MKTTIKISLFLLFTAFLFSSCEDEPDPTFNLSTTVSPTEGGVINISPQSPVYNRGDIVTLTPVANEGWIFEKWEGDASGTSNPLQVIMNSDQAVTGVFVRRDYSLNINIEGEGSVEERIVSSPSSRQYPFETIVELTPIPAEGWEFDSWSGDLSGSQVPQQITISGEKTVNVNFKEIPKFYLHENGITCLCPDAEPGEKGFINGVEYEAVDNDLIRERRAQGADMTKLCTSLVTNMASLFRNLLQTDHGEFNQEIGNWDVSNVTNMNSMFAYSNFDKSIEKWDVGNVSSMHEMFLFSSFNQSIEDWDVSNVVDMRGMFSNSSFNQPIENWNVSKVVYMSFMFFQSPFNQPLNDWDVSHVSNMNNMFHSTPFNQSLENWNVSNVKYMSGMFLGTPFNQPLNTWDVSNVENMSYMFSGTPFNQPIGDWNVGSLKFMDGMFNGSSFNQPIDTWNVGNVISMGFLFSYSMFNQPIGNWNVSNVTDMGSMFSRSDFNQPIEGWDVGNVTDMSWMFSNSKFNQPIGKWNVAAVTDMNYMFSNSSFNQDISNWCVSKISSEPENFSVNSPLNQTFKPVWGTCTGN